MLSLSILVGTLISNLLIATFVYKNNPKSATNKVFGILGIIISLWLIILFLSQNNPDQSSYLILARMSVFLAAPMSMMYFMLAHTLPHSTLQLKKRSLIIMLVATGIVMAINLSPYTFTGVELSNGSPQPIVGPGMPPFGILSTFFSIGAVFLLIKKALFSSGVEREQFKYITVGILLMLGLIIGTIFVPVVIYNNTSFVPFAPLYTVLFLGLTAYVIIRHRFLDIRLIVGRAIAFLLFIFLCSGAYTIIVFWGVERIFNITIDTVTKITAVILSIFAALSFQPVFSRLSSLTNRIFFKGSYDSNKLLAELTQVMAQTIDLKVMTTSILKLLNKEMRVTKSAFLIIKNDTIESIINVNYPKRGLITKSLQEYFLKYLKRQSYIFEEMAEGKVKKFFRSFDIEVSIPIQVDKVNVAVLILGPKLSGEIYNVQDINLLNIFASQAGIAIQNAESYEEIKKFNVELEQRVEERTRELKESQERELAKARDIAKLKDEFVFIASHELRTPVTAIRGFLQLVESATKDYPPDVKENLGYMAAASEHLSQLINDLLEISRSEAGTMKIAVQPTNIVPIIKAITQEVSPQANEHKIDINLDIHPKAGLVLIDEKKTKEVMMNLLSNAVKYNRDGGNINISVFPFDHNVMVEVKDRGYGIPENQQAKIFEKFFRATNEKTGDVLGTGLGLFITRMLVEKMGGKIMFSSIEGKGSTFAVLLPAAPQKK